MTATLAVESVWAAREIITRLNDPETGRHFERWVERARGCERPIRLTGTSSDVDTDTGEIVREFTSTSEPDGVVLKPCGNRRAQVCEPCSDVYRGDAWQLVISGLRGGKGVPETITAHPMVFATFTAPGCGPVHTAREINGRRLPCRPRRDGETCPHGRSLACGNRHKDDDPCLGEAICPDCFDYERSALWNHNAGRLFRRTRTYVERELARQAGVTQKLARLHVRVSYVKVAEFQRRGVVHFHTLWRLDAAGPDLAAPPERYDAQLLADAIAGALPKSTVPAETADAQPYGWGRQHEIRVLELGDDAGEAGRIAAYIAKYATKSTEAAGAVTSRIRNERELRGLSCRDHARRQIESAWRLGARPELDGARLRRWAHQLGYGGHCFTKSRRYSTTFRHSAKRARSTQRRTTRRARTPRKVTTTSSAARRGGTRDAATRGPEMPSWPGRQPCERASGAGRRVTSCGVAPKGRSAREGRTDDDRGCPHDRRRRGDA